MPYAKSLDPDDMPSNSASHPDPSCLTLGPHFHNFLGSLKYYKIEADEKLSRRQYNLFLENYPAFKGFNGFNTPILAVMRSAHVN